jgi:uncharacterized protein (DUF885 family)
MKKLIKNGILVLGIISLSLNGCQKLSNDDSREYVSDSSILLEIPTITQEEIDLQRNSFDTYTEALVSTLLISSPVDATFSFGNLEPFGLEYLLYELDDFNEASISEDLNQSRTILSTLNDFNYDLLSDEQQKTYDVLYFHNSLIIEAEDYIYYYNELQPTSGAQINIPLALMQIEFETPTEIDAYLTRLSSLPRLFEQIIDYEKKRATLGLIMPEYLYDLVIEQINGMLVSPSEFMMYLSFCDKLDALEAIGEEDKTAYKERCLAIITHDLYPAYTNMITELTLLKKSSVTSAGISQLPDGQSYYEYLIKSETSYEMSAEELKNWAYTQLTKSISDIQVIISNYDDFSKIENLALYYPEFSSLDEIYAIMDQCLEEQFYDYQIPRATEAIIPSYLEDYLAAGFYFPISIDGEDYGTMYLGESTYENIDASTLDLYFHENIPGHHMYFSYFYNSDVPLIRKLYSWLPYEEGWAQYIQNLTVEYYGLDNQLENLLKANNEIGYYYMLILDIGLNYDGLSREDAISTLVSLGYYEASAESCVNRMIANPGEVIHYIYGYYKINSYLALCKEALMDDFDIKSFHQMILENADLPFFVMDDVVNDYIQNKKATTS